MVHEGSVTADTICTFLSRLAAGMRRKIYLVVDDHSIHKPGVVQKHLEALGGPITLFFLPPYSPDLNADEWGWKQVKQRIARQTVRTRHDLKGLHCPHCAPYARWPITSGASFRTRPVVTRLHKFKWLYQLQGT